VTIQQPGTASQNSQGDDTTPWVTLKEVWASIQPTIGSEFFGADVRLSEATHVIGMRYRSGITTKMRVTRNGRIFDIKFVKDPDERHRELQLLCTERGV
jgi:SPP1 family predicted phage head-tail adaptor